MSLQGLSTKSQLAISRCPQILQFWGINDSSTLFKVRVTLIEEPNVCSSASKRGTFRQEVRVGPQSTRAVPFILIPMKEGEFRVEVKAAVKDSSLSDGVVKLLQVVVREAPSLGLLNKQ